MHILKARRYNVTKLWKNYEKNYEKTIKCTNSPKPWNSVVSNAVRCRLLLARHVVQIDLNQPIFWSKRLRFKYQRLFEVSMIFLQTKTKKSVGKRSDSCVVSFNDNLAVTGTVLQAIHHQYAFLVLRYRDSESRYIYWLPLRRSVLAFYFSIRS